MRRGWFVMVALGGCTGTIDNTASLRFEPSSVELDVELGRPPPSVALRVVETLPDGREIEVGDASLVLEGAPVGALVGMQLASDGKTGGAARIVASYADLQATVPVESHVREVRLVDGAPAAATSWFASPRTTAYDAHLEPGDGAVLPGNLGRLDIDFGAAETDVLHEVELTSPFLDLRVYAPGRKGTVHVALTAAEWSAIAATVRGSAVDVDVRSVDRPGGAIHADHVRVAIADLDASALMLSGRTTGRLPWMFRYDMRAGEVQSFATGIGGACLGCHVTVSPDGSRILAASIENSIPIAKIVDASSRTVIASATTDSTWTSAAFDPAGTLITGYNGVLTARDGSTLAPLGTLATAHPAAEPTISPAGDTLAYVALDSVPNTYLAGDSLVIQSWDAGTLALGAPRELVHGGGISEPELSPDGAYVVYTRNQSPFTSSPAGVAITAVANPGVLELSSDPRDQLARWASPIQPTSIDGAPPEPMVWLAIVSTRPVGVRLQDSARQLWLMGFHPESRTVTRPFHLPGQPVDLEVLHAPMRTPL